MRDLLRANRFARFAVLYGACTLVLLGVFGGMLRRIGTTIREHTGLLERRDEITRSFETLLGDLRETEKERRALSLIRPHPRELVSFVRGVEGAAARSFIEQKISSQPSIFPAEVYTSPVVKYRASLLGPWEKVEAYLGELQALPHLVRVEAHRMSTALSGDLLQQGQADAAFAVAVLDPSAEIPAAQRSSFSLMSSSPSSAGSVGPSPSPSPSP